MDREQMIEVMVEEAVGSYSVGTDRKAMTRAIEDALAALEAAGVVMVPRESVKEITARHEADHQLYLHGLTFEAKQAHRDRGALLDMIAKDAK